MEQLLTQTASLAVSVIQGMALILITVGTVQTFFTGLIAILGRSSDQNAIRAVWIRYSQWLIAGLTFQLAADIIDTSIAPDWDDIGQLAAIAVIRTFLNFFLERDQETALRRSEAALQVRESDNR